MNILIESCPEVVEVNGVVYPINSDHRTSILFSLALRDPKLTEEQKLQAGLNLYYGDEIPEDLVEAINVMFWFFTVGKVDRISDSAKLKNEYQTQSGESNKKEEVYSFDYDSESIFSSFFISYNIDLTIETMHWWKFMALFNTLPEDSNIKEIIKIRKTKITSKMSNEEKKNLRKLKAIYALPIEELYEDITGEEFGDALGSMF